MDKADKRKKWAFIVSIAIIIGLMVLLIISNTKTEDEILLPPDVVQLKDGSFISLSHFYEMGYLSGTFDAAEYIASQNVFKENTKAILDLDTIFDKCHKSNKNYFDQYNKPGEYFNNTK